MADETSGDTDDRRPDYDRLEDFPRQLAQHSYLDLTLTVTTRRSGGTGLRRDREQPDFLEFRCNDVLVERLHDVFVGACIKRARDMVHSVLSGAEHHLGLFAARQAAQTAKEFVAVHHRHVPVEQNRLGQSALADLKRLLAVLGLDDLEIHLFQDSPCYFSDDA
jgi:hypothetical protein